ncbi:MAG: tRNA guanosine(34) transglycosylase Tgt [Bacteriovoracia bacterium]
MNVEEVFTEPTQPRRFDFVTDHGVVTAPQFMPVGTQGTVKGLTPDVLSNMGVQMLLGNTYHLYLRPGHERVERLGGLHKMMNWNGPILTDSGGFQVFSLGALRKITNEGVEFQSHLDGSKHFFTPEKSIEIQRALGSDVVMVFDECPPFTEDKTLVSKSMDRTLEWAKRCRDVKLKSHQKMFGIVQGGLFYDLRMECLEKLISIGFDGYALGGLSIGEPIPLLYDMVRRVAPKMPSDKPRYLMGVGRPQDILVGASYGIDLFDCVMPTRNARNGQLFTSKGKINIKNTQYTDDPSPLDEACRCYTCQNFSKAYLRHLFVSQELLSSILNSLHNVYFYLDIMRQVRLFLDTPKDVNRITFDEFASDLYKKLN